MNFLSVKNSRDRKKRPNYEKLSKNSKENQTVQRNLKIVS